MNDEQLKLLVWSYKQGFLDAVKLLTEAEHGIDEEKKFELFKSKLGALKGADHE